MSCRGFLTDPHGLNLAINTFDKTSQNLTRTRLRMVLRRLSVAEDLGQVLGSRHSDGLDAEAVDQDL